jgi:hypothetical protein
MNGVIAAHIAVEAMREQFEYSDNGRLERDPKRTAPNRGFARVLRSLVARVSHTSSRPTHEPHGVR